LKPKQRYSKTIFSAEYVLKHYFNITQLHLADDDVEHETMLLEKILKDHGEEALEYGFMYPVRSAMDIMRKIARRALDMPKPVAKAVKGDGFSHTRRFFATKAKAPAAPAAPLAPLVSVRDIIETDDEDEEELAAAILESFALNRPPTPHPQRKQSNDGLDERDV
jgi:hypothetical protein